MSVRKFKSTAFAPILPNSVRPVGYDYKAFPIEGARLLVISNCPGILTDPEGASGDVGASAQFSVLPTSITGVTYRWQVSADAGTTWSDLSEGAPYIGTQTDTLTIDPISLGLTGRLYRATIIKDGCIDLYSGSALLTVGEMFGNALLVGGGGGGGGKYGGGGSGGDVIDEVFLITPSTTYPIVVGSAGTGGSMVSSQGLDGGNTTFSTLTALGGVGGGGGYSAPGANGKNGVTGSGGAGLPNLSPGGIGTTGFNGGKGRYDGGDHAAGGGGAGASQSGVDASVDAKIGGDGGDGTLAFDGNYYGGGGGGSGAKQGNGGIGGIGGLGGGGTGSNIEPVAGGNATPNTGGGGGGGCRESLGGNGAAGIFKLRYAGFPIFTGGTIVESGGYTTHTFTSSGSLTPI